jgi:hypothetical protein
MKRQRKLLQPRSGSTVMNSGWTAAAAAPSWSIADAIACNSLGHMSEQNSR